jgi:vesicle-associated membrane protein 4
MSETSSTNIVYVKYFLIGNIDTNTIITEYSTNALGSKEKKNANQIFQRICKSNERRYEERNIISAKENKYYFSLFEPNVVFIVYAAASYPEKLKFGKFDEVRNENVLSMINEETKELNPSGRQCLKQIIEKYQEKEKIDKMASIQKSVDDAKIEIKKNINKMVENGDDIETLEDQAKQLSIASEDYLNSAEESKNIAIWQNFKMWIIIFSVILFIFVIILYIIF